MKLDDQVCSLEYAQKLKEMSVIQDSCFYWVENFRGIELCGKDNLNIEWSINPDSNVGNWSAFTVAELLELLPTCLVEGKRHFWLTLHKAYVPKFNAYYYGGIINSGDLYPLHKHTQVSGKAADCLAKMLIYLIENKIT